MNYVQNVLFYGGIYNVESANYKLRMISNAYTPSDNKIDYFCKNTYAPTNITLQPALISPET
jgi:hypothetical protein